MNKLKVLISGFVFVGAIGFISTVSTNAHADDDISDCVFEMGQLFYGTTSLDTEQFYEMIDWCSATSVEISIPK